MNQDTALRRLKVRVFTLPTDQPESDGTLEWKSTTLVLVTAEAGSRQGLGYTYSHAAAASVIRELLAPLLEGCDALGISALRESMIRRLRNFGQTGLAMDAMAAVDNALWDLKAKILGLPLVSLLGRMREKVPAYGSGGFTSYSILELQEQLGVWAGEGFAWVKMKVGRDPAADPDRVAAARQSIGPKCGLMVDANWAYSRKQALAMAESFSRANVSWFEEPVNHHDLAGLRLIRDRAPAGMEIAAGEYGTSIDYLRNMLEVGAVDVLQADATRFGISGFLEVAALCQSHHILLSSHAAPTLHCHPCAAIVPLMHAEYFHDHTQIEQILFDGAATAKNGFIEPDLTRPGLGIELKEADAGKYET